MLGSAIRRRRVKYSASPHAAAATASHAKPAGDRLADSDQQQDAGKRDEDVVEPGQQAEALVVRAGAAFGARSHPGQQSIACTGVDHAGRHRCIQIFSSQVHRMSVRQRLPQVNGVGIAVSRLHAKSEGIVMRSVTVCNF
jgi:hypothetical protein